MKYLFLFLISFNVHAFVASNQLNGSVNTVSTKVLDPLANRAYLGVNNLGPGAMLIKVGGAHVATEGLYIPSGSNWYPEEAPADSVYIKAFSGTVDYHLLEGKK